MRRGSGWGKFEKTGLKRAKYSTYRKAKIFRLECARRFTPKASRKILSGAEYKFETKFETVSSLTVSGFGNPD